MAVTLTQAYPQLPATMVDLPTVTPITSKLVAETGATARVTVRAADVVRGPVPGTWTPMCPAPLQSEPPLREWHVDAWFWSGPGPGKTASGLD